MDVIDLFAGCGGLSLGFEMAGFDIPLAIEIDEWACETYTKNHPNTAILMEDIEFQEYNREPTNDYQKWARTNSDGVYNHIAMRHTQRIIERFENIGYGQSVADVDECHQQRKRGDASKISGKVFSQNNMRPYPNKPCPTITASFQSNFVHPYLNRNFTAREGARIQSFPDTYIFCGKRTTMSWEKNISQYQQIGNAVPPLLGKVIAECIIRYLHDNSVYV